MTDDYEIDDLPCPACGHSYTHSRSCSAFGCEEGFIDEYEDDPINFAPGEEYIECDECHGHGLERWCPKCGADYWLSKDKAMRDGTIVACAACKGSGNADRGECEKCSGNGWIRNDIAAARGQGGRK